MDQETYLAARRSARREEVRQFLLVCSGLLSLPLFLVFWLADVIYVPEHKWGFLFLRLLMVPACLMTNYVIREHARTLLSAQIVGTVYTLCNSVPITIMIFLTEGAASPYYAGLNLVACGIIPFVPWERLFFFINVLLIYVPFLLVGGVQAVNHHKLPIFLVNSFFIAGTIIISCVVRYFTERLRKNELESQLRLQDEVESRERVIKQKTEEGIRLLTLTKQFSPQVVHTIQQGKLDILGSTHKARICAIFIDIVNSTEYIKYINSTQLTKIISMFMDDTMKVLLKYDITIDKFLGDGVLGFSNDPIAHSDYVERVVCAALEVKERIASRHELYSRYCYNNLQIRIGIAEGEASLGFYGGEEYFKSYTAIGKVINFASRLCASADADQILVSQEVAAQLPESVYKLKPLGERSLKGFDNEGGTVFELASSPASPSSADILVCPSGHGVLHLDIAATGIYVFQCRSCGYVEGTSSPFRKAA